MTGYASSPGSGPDDASAEAAQRSSIACAIANRKVHLAVADLGAQERDRVIEHRAVALEAAAS